MYRHPTATTSQQATQPGKPHAWLYQCLQNGLASYCLASAVAVIGVLLGLSVVKEYSVPRPPQGVPLYGDEFLDTLTQADGQYYLEIAASGYRYDPNWPSSVAFFPVYPLLVRCVFRLTGMPIALAGLLVSQTFLVGAFVLLFAYVRERYVDAPEQLAPYVVLAFGFFPTTMFLRLTYTEPLFIALAILVLYGIQRKWSVFVVALIIGLATATRPVGVALVLPFVLDVWRRNGFGWKTVGRLACLVPLALWGLLAYMVFLYLEFGDPLVYVKAQQEQWLARPPFEFGEKLRALITLEPIWSVYQPSSPAYWKHIVPEPAAPLFNIQCANPIHYVLAIGLIILGAAKRWLSCYETLLAGGLLFIPYVTRSYEMCMVSHGRFVAVVFPVYLVLGNVLCRSSKPLAGGILALFALYLTIYAAFFAAGYSVW